MDRFEVHSHTEYSNIRLIDSINKPIDLIKRAREIGLKGIAITDHECLASHILVNKYAQELQKEDPSFKIALGNEIYLTSGRNIGPQRYYHFILIAKNAVGHRALRELSSKAWMNEYRERGMERVPTLYSELQETVLKYPGALIATTACLGGELSTKLLQLIKAEKTFNVTEQNRIYDEIVNFMLWNQELFHDDFYVEIAPGCSVDQIMANKRLLSVAAAFGIKVVIGTDAHFLKKEDRFIHKAFLNSKDGEREVDAFYEYSYLQTEEEIREHLAKSEIDSNTIDQIFTNSIEIYNKIENYSLLHKQQIPKVDVKDYPKSSWWGVNNADADEMINYPVLKSMFTSEDKVERYWVNQCWEALEKEIGPWHEHLDYVARLEEEADTKKVIGEKLETNMFLYPVTLQHYVDMFWECGSMVGAGRGSSCSGLNHYLLGVTQLNPIEWNLPWFRYLNKERVELGDIDLDLCPSKRGLILQKIKEERGQKFIDSIDKQSRENLGCTLIATFGTEGTKSAILTACRGYRSEGYPDGIDNDTAQYMSSLIPSERGFLWPLEDVVYGNKDLGRKPITSFVVELQNYPGLLDIMLGIQGLISRRGSHASGVILFNEDPYEHGCFMRTPKGEIITQYDLHDCEAAGLTKYDFLVTEVQDKLVQWIKLLKEAGKIEKDLSLREVYNKYLHPRVLPLDDKRIWEAIDNNEVLNIFQFDSDVGSQAAKRIQPKTILELTDANGLMRLMASEKGQETPMDKYIRFKNNINLWYEEMEKWGLTKEEQEAIKPYFESSYGVPPSQEQLMRMLMDEKICHFTLAEANAARKIVGKKQMTKIPELREKVLDQASSRALGNYIWKNGVGPQMGYSFSVIHALAYSFIGFQTAYVATHWNPIYWNTACLIVNSGALDTEDEDAENGTNYGKMAKAIGDCTSKGINISLIDINHSGFSFKPDEENNQILFGLKGVNKVGDDVIRQIIGGRPYKGIVDFMERCPQNKTVMISLIKAGAFDKLDCSWAGVEPRKAIMAYYISKICNPKTKLTLQNLSGLISKGMIPDSLEFQKKMFLENKKLKKQKCEYGYMLDENDIAFIDINFECTYQIMDDNTYVISDKTWDSLYKKEMTKVKEWLTAHQEEALNMYNDSLFLDEWNKYAGGTLSAWEMESLCFYYHAHELSEVDVNKYGIRNFCDLPETPIVDYFFRQTIPIYRISRIMGTVIAKNDVKSTVTLLTTSGVVNVKFNKEYFAMFNRQLSEMQADGTKKVKEKGWFTRGSMLMVQGYRREDTFVSKIYKSTGGHQLYKIDSVDGAKITLTHERYGMEAEGE